MAKLLDLHRKDLPLVDGHVHLGSIERISDLQTYFTRLGLDHMVLLSLPLVGTSADWYKNPLGEQVQRVHWNPEVLVAMAYLDKKLAPLGGSRKEQSPLTRIGKGIGFGCFDNRALLDPAFPEPWNPEFQVEKLYRAGFSGIKMWEGKPELQARLGIPLDDPRLILAYRKAGELGMPVLIHVADPVEFWQPGGEYGGADGVPNGGSREDTCEKSHEDSQRGVSSKVPSFDELLRQTESLCSQAPNTRFIFPHLLFLAHELPRLAELLSVFPQVSVDLAPGNYFFTALSGIQNFTDDGGSRRKQAQDFFQRFANRILFGTDGFFLPFDLSLLPGTSVANNLERFTRLWDFLSTDSVGVSPFSPVVSNPLFRGLDLDSTIVTKIMGENILEIFPKGQHGEAPDLRSYLDEFFGTLPGSEERQNLLVKFIRERINT